jgi:hypothetical protein
VTPNDADHAATVAAVRPLAHDDDERPTREDRH